MAMTIASIVLILCLVIMAVAAARDFWLTKNRLAGCLAVMASIGIVTYVAWFLVFYYRPS